MIKPQTPTSKIRPTITVGNNSLWRRAIVSLSRKPQFIFCVVVLLLYIIIAISGYLDWLPNFQKRVGGSYEMPSWSLAKILGTDIFGRSVLFKILSGAQTAVTMGFLVTIIALPLGITLGALSGYYGSKIDVLITWLYSVMVSIPSILLIIAISYSLGKGLIAICIAMAATYWIGLCRMIRGEFLKHKESEYVLASKLLGSSDARIIFKHILPNVLHLAIVTGSLMILGAIKAEVLLTYIGVGIQDGASWGAMISAAPGELTNGIWWPLTGVVFAMLFNIYALNIIGDYLRDALDPKLLA